MAWTCNKKWMSAWIDERMDEWTNDMMWFLDFRNFCLFFFGDSLRFKRQMIFCSEGSFVIVIKLDLEIIHFDSDNRLYPSCTRQWLKIDGHIFGKGRWRKEILLATFNTVTSSFCFHQNMLIFFIILQISQEASILLFPTGGILWCF